MYYTTGRLRILRKSIVVDEPRNIKSLVGHEDVLQQEFRCDNYGNLEWRDVPIEFIGTEDDTNK
jgi:hypothetical protein